MIADDEDIDAGGVVLAAPSHGEPGPAELTRADELLLGFLESACHEMGMPFDFASARQTIANDCHAPLGDVCWDDFHVQRLQALADCTQVRVDQAVLNLREAVELVRPRAPLGVIRYDADGQPQWTLIVDHRGRRVRTYDSVHGQEAQWLTMRELAARLKCDARERRQWLLLQPALPCAAEVHDHHGGPTPLARYLALLAPDRSDIGVIGVFAIVVGLLALSTPIAVEALVNTVAFGRFVQPVLVLAAMLFVVLTFAAVMRGVQVFIAEIIQRRVFVRVAADLAHRLPRVRGEVWTRHYGPELVNRFFEVVTVQKVTSQLLLDGIALLLQTIVGMTVIAFYHPVLLGFNAFFLVFILAIVFVLGRSAVATSLDESRRKYATAAWLEDLARHHLTFRSPGSLNFALERADHHVVGYLTARATHFRILMRPIIATLTLQVVASTVLLGLGGWLVIRGELTLGQLVAAELIVTLIVGGFTKIGKYLEGYYDVMASVDKLGHLFDLPVTPEDGGGLERRDEGIAVGLDDLHTQPEACGHAIRGAAFIVRPGQRLALTGSPARLRQDLLEVIGGMRDPARGHVEFDGFDIRRIRDAELNAHVALVSTPEVFDGTIAENMHVGRTGVGDGDIRAALAATQLLDEILDLPSGLATHLETDGRILSHDQLTRLMLARAVAGRPRLLLVDGAFDAIPDEMLHAVLRGMADALPQCTWIVSTGRREVAEFCQREVAVEGATVREVRSAGNGELGGRLSDLRGRKKP